jgi:hypothetical protein
MALAWLDEFLVGGGIQGVLRLPHLGDPGIEIRPRCRDHFELLVGKAVAAVLSVSADEPARLISEEVHSGLLPAIA